MPMGKNRKRNAPLLVGVPVALAIGVGNKLLTGFSSVPLAPDSNRSARSGSGTRTVAAQSWGAMSAASRTNLKAGRVDPGMMSRRRKMVVVGHYIAFPTRQGQVPTLQMPRAESGLSHVWWETTRNAGVGMRRPWQGHNKCSRA